MSNHRPTLHLLALGVGLACAGLLFWVWRSDFAANTSQGQQRARPATTDSARAPATAGPDALNFSSLDPETRALFASLQSLLARNEARAREALLSFKDEAGLKRFIERAEKAGLIIVGRLDGLRAVRVRYDALNALQSDLLQNAADYSGLGANYLVNIPGGPSKEDRAALDQVPFGNAALPFIGVTGEHSQWGRGTTIAILDTGVAPDATFGTGRLRTLDIGLGLAPGSGQDDGHGTAVAALAAGLAPDAPGVAPAAGILSIRVTDANATSDIFTLAQAIVAAVDAGAKIVNVSLGGYATSVVLDAAIGYATSQGALIVAAAGNDQAAQLAWPAADPRVVSVGAVDRAEQQVYFSNSGPQLQLSAPGYGVQTAWLDGQRVYVDGTSASAPIVAGAIAAVMSQNPSLTAAQAAQLLSRTASDAGAASADPAFGNGIVNLGWAMNSSTPGYIDTAVSSHYYDAANNQMQFVVQNRSAQTVSGMSLAINAGTRTTNLTVPSLAAGETYIAKVAVDDTALTAGGNLPFSTQLTNPPGLVDHVPANNRKATVLSPPDSP